ncbi:MAG: ABC transporter substrate-binding protein [Deltaproteobacteria bacterium]|nr:ABC transporter substrate-binding protein [Deltaproteobacteria bacterium]
MKRALAVSGLALFLCARTASAAEVCAAEAAVVADGPGGKLLERLQREFPKTRHWFAQAAGIGFQRGPAGLSPDWATVTHPRVLRRGSAGERLAPTLPERASGATLVALDGAEGVWVRTTPLDALPVPVQIAGGMLVYPGAYGRADAVYKLTPTHVDEYIYVPDPEAQPALRFRLQLGPGVARLAVSPGLFEVYDRGGAARLRLERPFARDSAGVRRDGTLHLDGDVLTLQLDLAGLTFPVLIDPDWTTTGRMIQERFQNAAVVLPDGDVLAVGGCTLVTCPRGLVMPACSQVLAASERYAPASGTWRQAAPMVDSRFGYALVQLPGGEVLVAGGCSTPSCLATTGTVEIYSPAVDRWRAAPRLLTNRAFATASVLNSGEVLVVGGCDVSGCTATAELYDPVRGSWRDAAPLETARGRHRATVLPDGRVLVTGGCETLACQRVRDGAELYDPVAERWQPAGTTTPRAGHSATLMPDGAVLLVGGCAEAACSPPLTTAERWTPTGITPLAAMRTPRYEHSAALSADGLLLVAGGCHDGGTCTALTELYDPVADLWSALPALSSERGHHASALLRDGRLLVVGGCNNATCIPFAETYPLTGLVPLDGGVIEPPPDGGPRDAGVDARSEAGVPPPGDDDASCGCRAGGRARAPALGPVLALGLLLGLGGLARPRARRRRLLPTGLALLAALLLVGCGKRGASSALRVGVCKLRIAAPVFAAADARLFAAHGVAVELHEYDTAQPMIDDLVMGRLDAAGFAAYPIALLSNQAGARLHAALALVEDDTHRLSYVLRRKGEARSFPADAAGARIGILPTAAYRGWLRALLAAAGLGPDAAHIVPLEPALQLAGLRDGAVDLLFTGDPMASAALASGVAELADDGPPCARGLGAPFAFGAFFLSDTLARRPTQAAALLAALDEAITRGRADPDLLRRALAAHVRPEQRAAALKAPVARYLTSGEVPPDWLAREVARARELGILEVPTQVAQWRSPR